MSVRRDKIQLDIEINGKKAGQSYGQLLGKSRALNKELKGLTPGTDAFIKKSAELKKVNDKLAEVRTQTRGVTKAMDKLNNKGNMAGKTFRRLIPILGAAFSLAKIRQFYNFILDKTAQLIHIENKAATVFGEATSFVEASAEQHAIAIGATTREYKSMATAAGDLLIPMGFQREEAALLSTNLVNLSGALSAWTGGQKTSKEVSDILTKALLGEREQLKTLGISIQEADVKQRLAEKGMSKLTGTALQQAKAMATLELITEKSRDAQEGFKTSGEGMIQTKARIAAKIRDVSENFAKLFIPVMSKVLDGVEKAIDYGARFILTLAAIPQFIKDNRVALGALAIALITLNAQSILAAGSTLGLAIVQKGAAIATRGMAIAQRLLNLAMSANPIGLIISAIALLVAGIKIAYDRSETFRAVLDGLGSVGVQIFNIFKEGLQAFADGWELIKSGNVLAGMKKIGEGLKKTNPVTLFFGEGKRLKEAFHIGFNVSKYKSLTDKLAEGLEKGKPKLGEKGYEAGQATGDAIIDGINARLSTEGEIVTLKSKKKETKTTKAKDDFQKQNKTGEEETFGFGMLGAILMSAAEIQKRYEEQLKAIEEGEDLLLDEAEKKFLEGVITEEVWNEQKLLNKELALQRELELMRTYGQEETKAFRKTQLELLRTQKEISDQRQDVAQREADFKNMIFEKGKEYAKEALRIGIELLGADEKAKKKHSKKIKAMQIAIIGINLQTEISGYWKAAAMNTANYLIPGWANIQAGIQTGLAVARTIGQIRKIAKYKFWSGGFTGWGAKHDPAGVVHRGEIVWSQEDIARWGGVQNVENMRLASGFVDGGFVTDVNTSPTGMANIPIGSTGPDAGLHELSVKMDILISKFDQFPKTHKAFVVYSELEAKQKEMSGILDKASI